MSVLRPSLRRIEYSMRYQFVKCGRQVYVLSLAVMLASGITLPAPAQAQSFFEMLFGSSKPAPPPAAPVYGGPARLLPPGADPGFGIRPPSEPTAAAGER